MKRQLSKGSLEPWSTVPWLTTHRIGAHHGYRIDGAEHAHRLAASGQQRERTEERTAAVATQESQRVAALSVWEDEGGKANAAGD